MQVLWIWDKLQLFMSGAGLVSMVLALVQPFPKRQIFNISKLKKFADDNFKFHENGGKFSIRVENTVGKGEIACYEQFLLFQQCFLRLVLQTCKIQGLYGKGLIKLTFTVSSLSF